MVLARCAGIVLSLVAAVRQVSGFGLGVGVVPRSAHVSRSTAATAARSAREGCGCWGGVGFVSAAAVAGGVCDVGQRAGRRRGGRNGGVVMMSRSNRGRDQDQQFTQGMTPQASEELPVCKMEDDPTLAEVLTACSAADERKAENIVALRVAHLTAVTEYMIVLEGNSRPQNQAIAQNIEETMEEVHKRVPKTQGSPESGWVLLDYGDIIVHIMTPKSRTYYDLESFWGNGTPVPLGEVIKPNVVSTAPALAEEVDPFWS